MDKLLSMMGIDLKDILIREALDNNKDTLVTCPNNCRCGKCGLYFIPTGNEGSDKCLLVLQTDGVYRHFPADREEMPNPQPVGWRKDIVRDQGMLLLQANYYNMDYVPGTAFQLPKLVERKKDSAGNYL